MRQTSAAEFAFLAEDVYQDSGKGSRVASWVRQNFYGDTTNGFFAAAYQTPRTKKLVVVFRGTDDGPDWVNNIENTAGTAGAASNWNSQLNTARSYFQAVRRRYDSGNCAVCGHSLGGFLASMVALEEKVLGATFNPAPLGGSGLPAKIRGLIGVGDAPRIVNFRLKGDLVSGLRQYNIGPMIELALSRSALWARASGWLGDLDPVMHAMSLMKEAVLLHNYSDKPPEDWV